MYIYLRRSQDPDISKMAITIKAKAMQDPTEKCLEMSVWGMWGDGRMIWGRRDGSWLNKKGTAFGPEKTHKLINCSRVLSTAILHEMTTSDPLQMTFLEIRVF